MDVDLGIIPAPYPDQEIRPDEPCRPRDASARLFLDPKQFVPLKHAITLSKLALLDWKALQGIAGPLRDQMGDPTDVDGPYSVMLEMVRSMDGSYQWQGYSMPYPRRRGVPIDVKLLEAGYPYRSGTQYWWENREVVIELDADVKRRPGFPFYRTKALREQVFAMLFPEAFEGEILRRREFDAVNYPFRPCPGDPFRAVVSNDPRVVVCRTLGDPASPARPIVKLKARLSGSGSR